MKFTLFNFCLCMLVHFHWLIKLIIWYMKLISKTLLGETPCFIQVIDKRIKKYIALFFWMKNTSEKHYLLFISKIFNGPTFIFDHIKRFCLLWPWGIRLNALPAFVCVVGWNNTFYDYVSHRFEPGMVPPWPEEKNS